MAPTSSSCITWLEYQPENSHSVIYPSFGSIVTMDEKELASRSNTFIVGAAAKQSESLAPKQRERWKNKDLDAAGWC
ncbi:hypothetical protein QYF36_022363 [Acer negundo]|nr:hypothetical protein QYF36_022363 [Acer negundo]